MKHLSRLLSVAAVSATLLVSVPAFADAIQDAVASDIRSAKAKSRDEYRNPQQTLRFFGIEPTMTVVEIWPGGGWYTDILAPLLKEEGQLVGAHFYITEQSGNYYKKARASFEEKIKTDPNYQGIKVSDFHPTDSPEVAAEGSADAVLTFRNVHNWYMRQGQEGVESAMAGFFKALKPGGVLGVVEHRLPESSPDEAQQKSGYMKQSAVIAAAKKAGFKLAASSEVNANPADTADHPRGVWTLPPRLALEQENREHYLAIGESDRMTLKFVKPK